MSDNGVTIHTAVVHPQSKGRLRLTGASLADPPAITPNFLKDPEDMRLAVLGVRFALDIFKNSPMKDMIDHQVMPGTSVTTDEQIAEHCKSRYGTIFHPCGTAKMAAESDPQRRRHTRPQGEGN